MDRLGGKIMQHDIAKKTMESKKEPANQGTSSNQRVN